MSAIASRASAVMSHRSRRGSRQTTRSSSAWSASDIRRCCAKMSSNASMARSVRGSLPLRNNSAADKFISIAVSGCRRSWVTAETNSPASAKRVSRSRSDHGTCSGGFSNFVAPLCDVGADMLSIGHEFARFRAMYALALGPIGIPPRAVEHAESRKCFEAVMSGPTVSDQYSRIPLTIVAGAPGVGKSSLVRHLLTQTTAQITAVAADESAVDPSFVVQRDGARLLLKNGSVCVMSDDDGAAALAALSEQSHPPDHVVFESHAKSNPRRLVGYGYMPGYYLDGLITVVDASSLAGYANDLDAQERLREQLSFAALVVVNK